MMLSSEQVCVGLGIGESLLSKWILRGIVTPQSGRSRNVRGRPRQWDLIDTIRLEITRHMIASGFNPWMDQKAIKGRASPLAQSLALLPTDVITERAFLIIFHEAGLLSENCPNGCMHYKIIRESEFQSEITAPGRSCFTVVSLAEVKERVLQKIPQLEAAAAEFTDREIAANL